MEALAITGALGGIPITMGTTPTTQAISIPTPGKRILPNHRGQSTRSINVITIATAAGLLITGANGVALSDGSISERSLGRQEAYASAKDRRRVSLDRLQDRIRMFASRQAGWDGDDGIAPTVLTQQDAISFIESLPAGSMPLETYSPGDGEILFRWSKADYFLEVGFYGDGTISWFYRKSNGQESFGDDFYDSKRLILPATLAKILMI